MDVRRVQEILEYLNEGLVEREGIVSMALLTVLSGQSVFLYGPPGTAKSMIASRLASVFDDAEYFEYLMQRFSTPEEVFGPISISELKNDNYVRKTKGFLPEADIAFLDEIWKSSPAILNTLLTIVNEHKFRNGDSVHEVPLKSLIAASNEFPAENSGLEALYDRFIVRLLVPPVRTKKGFNKMLSEVDVENKDVVDKITSDEWFRTRTLSRRIPIAKNALSVIAEIRKGIKRFNSESEEKKIYVSDRRWVKSALLMRAAAYICGRSSVDSDECMLLMHTLWSSEEEIKPIRTIVTESIASQYNDSIKELNEWTDSFSDLENRITTVLNTKPVPPECFGYTQIPVRNFYGEESLKFDYDGMNIVIPLSRLRKKNGFTQAAKDIRTGKIINVLIKVEERNDDETILSVNNRRYILTKDLSDFEKKRKSLLKELAKSEGRLNKIYGEMDENAVPIAESPFLMDEDIEFLNELRSGHSDKVMGYRKRISELRGSLDGYGR